MSAKLVRLYIAVCAVTLACPVFANEPAAPETLITPEQAIVTAARERLSRPGEKLSAADAADRAALVPFYESRNNAPLWVTSTGLSLRASATISEIKLAGDWALDVKDFNLPELSSSAPLSEAELAEAEAKLSTAVLKYARFARGGRIPDPSSLASYLDRKPPILEPAAILDGIAKSSEPDAYLRGLHPKHAQFEKLRQKLLELRKPAQSPVVIVEIPTNGPILKPGTSHPDVALIRARLKVPAVAVADTPSNEALYDDALVAAVKKFQSDNGMSSDGFIGRSTRTAFNAASGEKIDEKLLIANMEFWRWMPESLGDMYVAVNIPEFMLSVVKNGEIVHEERIIAGQIDKQTPVFSNEIATVVLHPYWGVPNSIKVNELWPSLARGGSYFQRSNLRLQRNGRDIDPQSVDWGTADIRNYDVFQPPGGSNVLGVVKFLFPNKHQTYMHDTPTKALFNSAQRTFSHGCMRVRNPVRLAEIILAEDKGWNAEQVTDLIKNGPQNNALALDRKIPVHITYFTASVDGDGKLRTWRDVYGHQKRVQLALEGKEHLIARLPDHLAPVKLDRSRVVVRQQYQDMGNFFTNLFGGF